MAGTLLVAVGILAIALALSLSAPAAGTRQRRRASAAAIGEPLVWHRGGDPIGRDDTNGDDTNGDEGDRRSGLYVALSALSKQSRGIGLFTPRSLPAGFIVIDGDERLRVGSDGADGIRLSPCLLHKRPLFTIMNDADFDYPSKWTADAVGDAMDAYDARGTNGNRTSRCTCKVIDASGVTIDDDYYENKPDAVETFGPGCRVLLVRDAEPAKN